MEALQIDISATRALTVTGRLVAGETAQVTIGGATPTALYLVAPDQTVVAACEAFTPTGQGSGGVGFLQLATEQIAALFAHTPAGRMVAVWALVNNADGVAGAGWIPVVSAPMPDELIDLDIDFYLRASQVGAGLAIVDGKLVCNVNPDNYLTKTEAADTYATQTALNIVDGVAQAATADAARANYDISQLATVARTGSYNDLTDKPTIPTVPVQSVNGQTGAVVLGASDVGALTENDLGNLSANIVTGGYVSAAAMDVQGSPVAPAARLHYALGSALNASGQLDDRTCNHVFPLADNVDDIVLTFPDVPSEGGVMLLAARDFLVLVTNTAGNTGNITFTPPTGAVVYGDGFSNSPASGETWLYSVTEVADNTFWAKSVKMEVVS